MQPPRATTSEFLAKWVRTHRHVFAALVVAVSLFMWTATVAGGWLLTTVLMDVPDDEEIRSVSVMSRATAVYDANDQPVFTIFKEQRIEVPLSAVSPHLIRAIVAVEDQRFFDHGGLDVIRVAGAAWQNLREGWGAQGGSTITQQLARQTFLTRDKTLQRKLRELAVATRLESAFTKNEILEMYLNKVYFGDGLYGVEAASLGYFGKHASELDVAEAALLAGIVKGPSAFGPTVSAERAIVRRNAALRAMRSARFIDEPTYQSAIAQELRLQDGLRRTETFGQYFKEEVRKQLVQQFGWERVYEGGLKVYTTLDPELQKVAEAEVVAAVEDIERRQLRQRTGSAPDAPLQAALVALDTETGEVRALVGGRSFDESRFNRATQARRQAGSAFKPFVYAAALEGGYTPATLITELDTPVMTLEGAWVPDDHSTGGPMTMRSALKVSSNRAAVRVLQDIGIPAALRAVGHFGIESVPGVPSLALGSGEVTLLSMTAAYATFANGGMRPAPIMIRRVEAAGGEVLFTAAPRLERAVSEATAFLMTSMLSDVIDSGTASQARRVGFRKPAAGKTGTTNEYRDAWFVGYTKRLATGVWVGYDQPRTIIREGYASTLAVPLWGRFMTVATKEEPQTASRAPRTVTSATICRLSGKLATDGCRYAPSDDGDAAAAGRNVFTEHFARGTQPTTYCALHAHTAPRTVATSGSGDDRQEADASAAPATNIAPPDASASATGEEPEPEPRRRGFWGRLFGR